MQRPRFRLWFLMVLVALVGIVLFGVKCVRTMRICDTMIELHRRFEKDALLGLANQEKTALAEEKFFSAYQNSIDHSLSLAEDAQRAGDPARGGYLKSAEEGKAFLKLIEERPKATRARIVHERERSAYHARMRQKYERARLRPWLLIPPDPPMPE